MSTSSPRSNRGHFHVDAPPDVVFPFFTAAGEREWAPGWDPTMLSGDTGRGSAFLTADPEGRRTAWVVTRYDASAQQVAYARFAEGRSIGLVDVDCSPAESGGTTVTVRYTLSGVDADGDAFVADFLSESAFATMIAFWKDAVNAAIARASEAARCMPPASTGLAASR